MNKLCFGQKIGGEFYRSYSIGGQKVVLGMKPVCGVAGCTTEWTDLNF